jgi:hypothetical protein
LADLHVFAATVAQGDAGNPVVLTAVNYETYCDLAGAFTAYNKKGAIAKGR